MDIWTDEQGNEKLIEIFESDLGYASALAYTKEIRQWLLYETDFSKSRKYSSREQALMLYLERIEEVLSEIVLCKKEPPEFSDNWSSYLFYIA